MQRGRFFTFLTCLHHIFVFPDVRLTMEVKMLSKFRVYLESVRFYHLCKLLSLPPDQKDQLLRAASSVGRNVGEGYGRVSHRAKGAGAAETSPVS